MRFTHSALALAAVMAASLAPAPAMAVTDFAVFGGSTNAAFLRVDYTTDISMGAAGSYGSATTTGSDGSSPQYNYAVGSFGGVTYGTILSFEMGSLRASEANTFTSSSLSLSYTSVVGNPLLGISASATTNDGTVALGAVAQGLSLAPTDTPGTLRLALPDSFTKGLQAIQRSGTNIGSVQLALTASARGAGAPGPVAGAGLPFLAVAGLAWMRRRRTARHAA